MHSTDLNLRGVKRLSIEGSLESGIASNVDDGGVEHLRPEGKTNSSSLCWAPTLFFSLTSFLGMAVKEGADELQEIPMESLDLANFEVLELLAIFCRRLLISLFLSR
jgi:hypothetical protein